MARHANYNWNLPEGIPNSNGGKSHTWESIHAALLMDIRDELQKLNQLLHCSNFVGIPSKLERIARNTVKPRKKRET